MTDGAWLTHRERTMFGGGSLMVTLVELETPTGRRVTQEVIRAHAAGVATLVTNAVRQVLLVWRHRVVPNTWAWEPPSGLVMLGESPVDAAARVVLSQAGWELLAPRNVLSAVRCPEYSDQTGYLVEGRAGRQVGGHDPDEAVQVGWFGRGDVLELIRQGHVVDVGALAALFWWWGWGAARPEQGANPTPTTRAHPNEAPPRRRDPRGSGS